MKKYFKKIISLVIILILILGLINIFKDFINISKAQTTNDTSDPFSGSTATGTATSGTTGSDSIGTSEDCDLTNKDCKLPSPPAPYQSKENELTISEGLKKGQIATAWALSLDLVNVLAIFVLLAIAFANILHLGERDSFSYKRMIPAFVVGLIAANFSHLICRAIIDFAGMLMNFFVPKELAAQVVGNIYTGMFSGWFGAAALGVGVIGTIVASFFGLGCVAIIIALILLGVPVIISFILWFLLAARVYVLWFLVILSPIAFFGMFFDPLKRTIGTWWNWFLMWTFMGPIAYFFIYLAEGFSRDTSLNGSSLSNQCLDPSNASQVGGLQKYLIVNILLVLAVYVPYALGSKIGMGLWAGIGKFAGGLGLWAGAGTGAAGWRGGGHLLSKATGGRLGEGMKKAQNPLTLPALPRGMENSAAGMLWENKRKADVENLSKNLKNKLIGGRIFGWAGGGDNMIKDDMSKFNDTSGWSAEGLVNHMNEGVKENNRLKRARGVRGLSIMAKDGRRADEQRAAQRALDALGVTSDEVASPENVGKLVSTARHINMGNRDPRTHIPREFQAGKPAQEIKGKELDKIGGTNVVEPPPPRDIKEPSKPQYETRPPRPRPIIRPTPEATEEEEGEGPEWLGPPPPAV